MNLILPSKMKSLVQQKLRNFGQVRLFLEVKLLYEFFSLYVFLFGMLDYLNYLYIFLYNSLSIPFSPSLFSTFLYFFSLFINQLTYPYLSGNVWILIKMKLEFLCMTNGFIITWMLHQIFMYSDKMILAAG